MTYTSGPTATADKPWQVGATTPQIEYRSVQLFDLFLKYKLFEHTELNASLQNLTDRYYLDPLAQSFMPAPGVPCGWGCRRSSEPPSPSRRCRRSAAPVGRITAQRLSAEAPGLRSPSLRNCPEERRDSVRHHDNG